MLNYTPIIRPYFHYLNTLAKRRSEDVRNVQTRQLNRLLSNGRSTLYGHDHGFDKIKTVDDFRHRVPVVEYPEVREYVMRMVDGQRDILWPGTTHRFAQSSGTSDGKSKYIPLTDESLKHCHYRGGADVVATYLSLYPGSKLFSGESFILGGSYGNALDLKPGVKVGDLSAHLIDNINPLADKVRIPSKETALLEDWSEKLPRLVNEAIGRNVTNISGVPSWFMTVLKEILKKTGATTIHDVWPNLEVFFHGGISFEPYREQYRQITDPSKMHYLETYNASEGFFAVQDRRDSRAMLLLQDLATFYEFVPLDNLGDPYPETLTSWEVEPGHVYALVITSCNGLWRYMIGDTVRVETVDPLRITIAGRTRHFINAFGEELMVYNADAAISRASAMTGASVSNYTAAPVFADSGHRGHHRWLVEFSTPPADLERFADILDRCLTEENSDYQAKRSGNIFLDRLELIEAPEGVFDRWLESTGKLGGQRKIPRLSNDPMTLNSILKSNNIKST